jgi:hypothetical protein
MPRALAAVAVATIVAAAHATPPKPLATLVAPDAAQGDEAGRSVAAAGRRILVGAPSGNPDGVVNRGSAWVHRLERDGTWSPEVRLLDPVGAANHEFGSAVAIDDLGDGTMVAIVGALRKPAGSIAGAGGASIYRFDGAQWTHEANLVAADPNANAEFGRSVAIRGDVAVVGAWKAGFTQAGALYVFRRGANGAWSQAQKLTAPAAGSGDALGTTLAMDAAGERIVAGAWGRDTFATNGGAALVWRRGPTGSYAYETQLAGSSVVAGDECGRGVAIDGDLLVVGSWPFFGDGVGKAYAHRLVDGVWTEEATLVAPDGATDDYFGFSVAVRRGDDATGANDRIACGAWADDIGATTNQGSVWLFERAATKSGGPAWAPSAQLVADDGEGSDYFGFSLAWLCDLLVVGARFDDTNGTPTTGSARVWWADDANGDGTPESCSDSSPASPDLDGDGRVNAADLAILLGAWGPGVVADLDGDGAVGASDLAILLGAWTA